MSAASAPHRGRRVLALLAASLLAGTALPAQAALYTYSFSGDYGNRDGPLNMGSFIGRMTWDTAVLARRPGVRWVNRLSARAANGEVRGVGVPRAAQDADQAPAPLPLASASVALA